MQKQGPFIMDAFPLELQEREKMPRQYVVNVIYTLAGQKFREWVDALVNKRHEEIAEQRQLYIDLDLEVAKAFSESKAVSTSRHLITSCCGQESFCLQDGSHIPGSANVS